MNVTLVLVVITAQEILRTSCHLCVQRDTTVHPGLHILIIGHAHQALIIILWEDKISPPAKTVNRDITASDGEIFCRQVLVLKVGQVHL